MKIVKICLLILIWSYLFILYGGIAYDLKLFPYKLIQPVVNVSGHIEYLLSIDEHKRDIRWPVPATGRKDGIITSKADRAHTGLTLYTSTHDLTARLIRQNGEMAYKWTIPVTKAWPEQAHINMPLFNLAPRYFYLRDAFVYPDGSLLTLIHATGVTPWGVGLVKVDKNANILWKHTGHVNNDFELGPDGTVYLIEHERRTEGELLPPREKNGITLEPAKTIRDKFLEDHLVILSPDGTERKRIPLLRAIADSRHAGALRRLKTDTSDPTHSNSIDYIQQNTNLPPGAERGDLLISMRNIEVMLVLDPESGKVENVLSVPVRQQHDIDLLDNGNLLMFDNQGDVDGFFYSRVIELDPHTHEIHWDFSTTSGDHELNAQLFGESERYDNGHTMIVNAEYGEILEVDNNGNVYWRYVTPLRKTIDGHAHTPVITHAEHVEPQRLNFLNDFAQDGLKTE